MVGRMHVVGRWLLGACIPVLVVYTSLVGCRSNYLSSREAVCVVRAASVLVDGVCVCVCVFVVVCDYLRLFVGVIAVGVC